MNLRDYQELVRREEELRRQVGRQDGVLQQIRAQLKEEFGAAGPKAARKLRKKMLAELADLEKSADNTRAAFDQQYGQQLSE